MPNNAKIESLLSEYKAALIKAFGDNIQSVVLFGSQAKGSANSESDYDFVVLVKNEYDWKYEKNLNDIAYALELKYDIFLDTHLISIFQLNNTIKGKDPLFINALKYGIYA